jgi:hypothetical protein
MHRFLSLLLIVVTFSVAAVSQTGGRTVSKTVIDSESGFSFVVPEKWESQKGDGGYVLGNDPRDANIVIKPHSYNTFEEFVGAEVNLVRDGLTQVGEIVDIGDGGRMFRTYKPNGATNLIVDTFFVPSKTGGGVMVVALSTDNAVADSTYQVALKLIKTIRFTTPVQSAKNSRYQSQFGGKKLSFFYTGNGYSERRTVWLCRSGSFISKSESSSVSALASGATSSGDQGNWRVQANGTNVVLVLDSTRGNGRRSFTVTARQASNEVALNGQRYFVETHNECN